MAFVVSRKEVGYFGYLCDQKLLLFHSPFTKFCGLPGEEPVVLPDDGGNTNDPQLDKPMSAEAQLEKLSNKSTLPDDGGNSNDPQLKKPVNAEAQPEKLFNKSILPDDGGSDNDPQLEKRVSAEAQREKSSKRSTLNCAAISNCGNFIAISDDNKQLHLWKRRDNKWSLLSSRTVPRKCLHLLFTNSGSDVIASDRGGDVHRFSVNEAKQGCELILGHICAILGVELTEDDAYIITCDRDAKIRVTCYPNTYSIETYCLGHREFVSALKLYSGAERLLLSGSGDGTLRLWKCHKGTELFCTDVRKNLPIFVDNQEAVKNTGIDDHAVKNSSTVDSQGPSVAFTTSDSEVGPKNVAVKCIRYCPETQVFAVLFYAYPHVAIFQMNSSVSSKSFEFVQNVNLQSVPLDAYFDSAGYLWVLLSSKDNCVAIFKSTVCSNSVQFIKLEEADSSKVGRISSEIHNNWRVFSLSIDVNNLYKPSYIRGFGSGKQSPVKEKSFEPKWKKNKVK